jgi:uncharacterized membrane protein
LTFAEVWYVVADMEDNDAGHLMAIVVVEMLIALLLAIIVEVLMALEAM